MHYIHGIIKKALLSHTFELIMSSARSSSRFLCEHCNRVLSKTQFYKHKRMYYDKNKRRWLKDRVKPHCNTDFNFGDDGTVKDFSFSDSSSDSESLLLTEG